MDPKKLDEKRIKEIREFQKSSSSNRRCFDCNEMGPQYICLDFNTFICTSCSGIHREFSHRIKSISMSTFTDTEVKNMVKFGGNDAAQKYWLARFDVNSQPSSNLNSRDRIRNFIRDVFIDRRWVYEEPKPKQEAPPKKEAAKAAKAPQPRAQPDFNPFEIAPPPPLSPPQSVAFGDFTSFDKQANGFADFSSQSAFVAGFNSFNTALQAAIDPFQQSQPQSNNGFQPFGAPASPAQFDTLPIPNSNVASFAAFSPPAAVKSNPFGSDFMSPPKASATSPAMVKADPFGEFNSQHGNPFTSPRATPAAAPVSAPVDFFASFDSHQTVPAGPASDPFGSFHSNTSTSKAVDPFHANAFSSPVANGGSDPFFTSPPDPATTSAPKNVAQKPPAADLFNAFDDLLGPSPQVVAQPPSLSQPTVSAGAPMPNMWTQPPPVKANVGSDFPTPAPFPNAYANGPVAPSFQTKAPFDIMSSSNNQPQSNPAYSTNASFSTTSTAYAPYSTAYVSNVKKPAEPASLIDPFASLDIGIKSSTSTPAPQQTYNVTSRQTNQTHYSNQTYHPNIVAAAPVAQKPPSSNPFDMF
ncbi:hypothetical protein LEN26_000146 [Aphanomyces euteiches]|nr:hypothetical protein AeMF1_010828 [Aphanomyces euteiches]KAH9164187.1 hypothetical protein LEN26_000146 [Aphanomyces euteiches]KAH9197023.1 hypothetical protein AeNC1_001017 [Aphanomyces euteiches]